MGIGFYFYSGRVELTSDTVSLMEMGKFVPQFLREFELSWDGNGKEEWNVHSSWFAKQTGLFVRYRSREKKTSS